MDIVKKTAKISLLIQFITGIISIESLSLNIDNKHQVLKEILYLENLVQTIEFCFYIWLKYQFKLNLDIKSISISRYYDWFFTTPTMLFSTIVFFKYQEKIENNKLEKFTIKEFYQDNKNDVNFIIITNCLMLLFGYLGEIKMISREQGLIIGFIFFGLLFNRIYKYANNSELNKRMFKYLIIIWGLYGIAYMLPEEEKNICYNILDIFAKNFFGVYLAFKIKKLSIN